MKNITIFSLLIFVIHAYPVPPQDILDEDILDDLNEANLKEETPVTEEYPIGGPQLMR